MDKKKAIELINDAIYQLDPFGMDIDNYDDLCKNATKILCSAKEYLNKPDWISVEDELPPYSEEVWCRVEDVAGVHYFQSSRCANKDRIPVFKYDENGFDVICVLQYVTHWRKIDKLEA